MPRFNVAITEIVEYLVPVEAETKEIAESVALMTFNASDDTSKYLVAIRNRDIEGVNEGTENYLRFRARS